jgi:hypothetical protein
MTTGGISRPTTLLADAAAIVADAYNTYQLECAGFGWAMVRVNCNKAHGMFLQGIGQPGGTAGDLYDNLTKLSATGYSASTAHCHVINVAPVGTLQILVHNEDTVNAGTCTVEVTLS